MRRMLLVLALLAPVERLDLAVQRGVQQSRTPQLEPVMKGATGVGRPANVLGALLGIALFDAAGPATARLALAALLPTNLVVEGLKRAVNRPRPDGEHKRSNASFPSSHAANAAALAWVLSRRWRLLAPAFWAVALTVAYSRIYLDRHYLSDVLVGLAIGMACGWLAPRLARRMADWRGRVASPGRDPAERSAAGSGMVSPPGGQTHR